MFRITPDPEWAVGLREYLKPYEKRVVGHQLFRDINSRKLSVKQFRGALVNFYPLIENFPKYMALNLAKVPAGGAVWSRRARYWLIKNINQERLHAGWWKEFARGFGVAPRQLEAEIFPPAEMDAINNYLWHVCTHGSLAEGISAANFAVEGPTGVWTKLVSKGIKGYEGLEGTRLTPKSLEWITAHADYDDRHPHEALEIVKAFAKTEAERERVKLAARRSLEYYALALDACYKLFK